MAPARGRRAARAAGDPVPEVLTVRIGARRGLGLEWGPVRAGIGRYLDIPVVVVRLHLEPRPEGELRGGRRTEIDRPCEAAVHPVALVRPPERAPRMWLRRDEPVRRRPVEPEPHGGPRELHIPHGVLVDGRPERPARRDRVAHDDVRGLPRRRSLRIAVAAVRHRADERVRGDEVAEELLDPGLPTLLQDGVDVLRSIDALLHERTDEVLTAGLLAEELEEQERHAVVHRGGVEIGPVVELGVGDPQIGLRGPRAETVAELAELRVPFVEPDRRAASGVELDHVAELVGDDRIQLRGAKTGGEDVDVDHLALRREFVHPRRLLVRAAEIPGGRAWEPREDEVDARVAVDPRRPLLSVEAPVGRIDLSLEARRRRAQPAQVDARVVRGPPLRVIGHEAKGRGRLDVLRREVVGPEVARRSDVLDRRGRPHGLESLCGHAVAAAHRAGEREPVGVRNRLREERGGHVEGRRDRRGERRRRRRDVRGIGGRTSGLVGTGRRRNAGAREHGQEEDRREPASHRARYPSARVRIDESFPPRK